MNSRRQFFKKFKEWKIEKNRKRRREEEGEDPEFESRGRPVPEDKISHFAKRQTISGIATLASSGMFWHDGGVAPELMSYLEVPTSPSICYFTLVEDHDTTAPGQSTPQAPPGMQSLLSPTDLPYMHDSSAMEHLEFSYVPLDMLDLGTPRLSPNCDVAPWLLQTIHSPPMSQPAEPSTAVIARTPSPAPFMVQLDNLPWFKFWVLFCTFLKAQGSMGPYLNKNTYCFSNISIVDFCDRITDYDPSLDHPTNCSDVHRCVSIIDGLQLRLSMPEESINLRYLLDLRGEQHRTDLGFIDEPRFGPIINVLFTSWTSDSPTLNTEENTYTLRSYFRPFILERHDGELLEGVARILGPLYDGLLQFLNYTINLLSNNLLSESDIDNIVRWIDEIQGYELFTKLLSTKSSTIEAFASNLLPSALRLRNALFTRILLDAGVNPNSPIGYQNIIPLQYAAQFGDIELVRILLNAGADVNAPPTDSILLSRHTALQAAAKNGNIELVQILLDAGADINASPSKYVGRTALRAGAENGNIEVVKILLCAGADINTPPGDCGLTALQAAAMGGNIELVKILLDAGASVNAPPSPHHGSTALQAASKSENIELVQILLGFGADVNAPPSEDSGYTALQAAAQTGNIKLVQILLDVGADVNAPPATLNDGCTALQAAAKTGNIELVQLLLNAGAEINAPPLYCCGYGIIYKSNGGTTLTELRTGTTLQAAAWRGNIEIVHVLLNADADVNAPPSTNGGRTALQAAAENENIELVQVLLGASADVNASPSNHYGRTALQAAAETGNIELVQMLLDAGANVNAPPSELNGRTALQAAAHTGSIELVQMLLGAGADVNTPPSEADGRTALQAAAENGNIELVQMLLDAGADINAPPSNGCGRTALQAAAEKKNIKLVLILLDANADVNLPPSEFSGRTALQAAVENANIELVEILLSAGAEINAPPSQAYGITAIQAAAIRGHISVAQLLLNDGADVNAASAIREGRTALEGAAEHGRIDLLQLLINAGADTNSSQCIRALKLAARNGHDDVCGVLNRFRKEGWTSPVKARQMEECEDQLRVWDEEYDFDY